MSTKIFLKTYFSSTFKLDDKNKVPQNMIWEGGYKKNLLEEGGEYLGTFNRGLEMFHKKGGIAWKEGNKKCRGESVVMTLKETILIWHILI